MGPAPWDSYISTLYPSFNLKSPSNHLKTPKGPFSGPVLLILDVPAAHAKLGPERPNCS